MTNPTVARRAPYLQPAGMLNLLATLVWDVGPTYHAGQSAERAMSDSEIGIFSIAEQRLAWIDKRQQLLARNIANANTPGYQSADVQPFAAMLQDASLAPTCTDPNHLPGNPDLAVAARSRPHERAPDGNAVNLEDELAKVAETDSSQALTENLYHKYMGMFMTVLGKSS